jgi:hypothetical protein
MIDLQGLEDFLIQKSKINKDFITDFITDFFWHNKEIILF